MNLALGFFLIFAGIYMLISGIRGKGAIYQNENVSDKNRKKYNRFVRVCCLCIAPVFIANFAFSLSAYLLDSRDYSQYTIDAYNKVVEQYNQLSIASSVTLWAALILAVVMVAVSVLIAGKE